MDDNPFVSQRDMNDMSAAVALLQRENERLTAALKAIYTVASKDGVAHELDRCYVYAANALMCVKMRIIDDEHFGNNSPKTAIDTVVAES
jgi:hypothetical protein